MLEGLNPLWIIVGLTVVGAIVKGLFWIRDVTTAKDGWARFTKDSFPEFAKEIRDDLRQVRDQVNQILLRVSKTIENGSPIRLSSLGEKIAIAIDAKTWVARIAQELKPKVSGMQPYEIDQFCERYVETELDAELLEKVARHAYEFGISQTGVLAVLRVVLRDELIGLTAD